MNAKITYLSLCCMALLSSCQEQKHTVPQTINTQTVIAQVGTQLIYKEDVDAELKDLPERLQAASHAPKIREQILTSLIRRAVLSQRAMALGLDKDTIIHHRIQRNRDTLLIEALREWQLSHMQAPTPKDIQNYYNTHITQFTIPEQIHARHILVRKKSDAVKIRKLLQSGKHDFMTLAAQYSIDDSNKARGGDLNWFPRGVMVPSFEQAAFSLQHDGDISQPVQTQYGWHIIQRLEKRPALKQSLTEAKDEIIQILQQQALNQWIESLIQESQIKRLETSQTQGDLNPAL